MLSEFPSGLDDGPGYGVIYLIVLVLLQRGVGADIGAVFGGGSSHTVFGGRGPASFLDKATIALATLLFFTSITLAVCAAGSGTQSVISTNVPTRSQPVAATQPYRTRGPTG